MSILFATNDFQQFVDVQKRMKNRVIYKKIAFDCLEYCNANICAEEKARQAYLLFEEPVFVIVPVLHISCLGNKPGIFVESFWQQTDSRKIIRSARRHSDFKISERSILAFHDGLDVLLFESVKDGKVPHLLPDTDIKNWWKSIFIPEGAEYSYCELFTSGIYIKDSIQYVLEDFHQYLINKNDFKLW